MSVYGRYNLQLTDPELFRKKVTTVFLATLLLVPLVYFKFYVPAWIYLSLLLALHLVFIYTYVSKMSWKNLAESRAGLAMRLLAVGFLVYLLLALKFHGSLGLVLANLLAGLIIHTLILVSLMTRVRVVAPTE